MSFKVKAGLFLAGILVLVSVLFMFSMESVQQGMYDTKADLIGTHRIASVYNETGVQVSSYEDKEMRFELVGERSVRIWMGDVNKKVMVINMGVTIADQ